MDGHTRHGPGRDDTRHGPGRDETRHGRGPPRWSDRWGRSERGTGVEVGVDLGTLPLGVDGTTPFFGRTTLRPSDQARGPLAEELGGRHTRPDPVTPTRDRPGLHPPTLSVPDPGPGVQVLGSRPVGRTLPRVPTGPPRGLTSPPGPSAIGVFLLFVLYSTPTPVLSRSRPRLETEERRGRREEGSRGREEGGGEERRGEPGREGGGEE